MTPIFSDSVMLAGWQETHNGGAKVTFWLPDASALDVFRGMTVKKGNTAGQRLACVLVEIGDDEKPVVAPAAPEQPKREPNELARKLHVDGYFRNPHLWLAIHDAGVYSLQEHKKWIESQPCAVHARCAGQVCLHHTDQSGDYVGGRRQPENPQKGLHFYGIPVCHEAHTWLHGKDCTREDKQRWRGMAIALTAGQMKAVMKAHLGIASLSEITQQLLDQFELDVGFL